MANSWRKALGWAAMATLFAINQAAAGERRAIVLEVKDHAAVPPALLASALAHAAAVYEAADARLAWVGGNETPDELHEDLLHLPVILLSDEMTKKKCHAEAIGANVLGRGSRATARAYIFVDRIMDIAARNHVDPAALLGTVIAHEVGHLLLPESSHTGTGIMAADLDLRSKAAPHFTDVQAEYIRTVAMGAAAAN